LPIEEGIFQFFSPASRGAWAGPSCRKKITFKPTPQLREKIKRENTLKKCLPAERILSFPPKTNFQFMSKYRTYPPACLAALKKKKKKAERKLGNNFRSISIIERKLKEGNFA